MLIKGIQEAVTIPVMAKARIGHFAEAQVLESLEIDYVDESEVLTPADEANHIDKWNFKVPFVCGATNLGEALRRIAEGAAMIRSKGEAGTGDIVEAVRHMRRINGEIKALTVMDDAQLATAAKEHQAPLDLVRQVARDGKLPVVLFCAGGIATPADASLMMQLGAEGVFVGSGIFKSDDPATRAAAIVEATTHFEDPAARRARLRGPRHRDDLARDAQARAGPAARQPGLVDGMPLVGVLALQGDFAAHSRMLRGLGADVREVRTPAGLEGLDGLVIPGGESTTMTLGIEREGLADPLRELRRDGHPGPRHLRGHDHARPRPPRDRRLALRAQRVRPPDPLLRGRPADPGDRRRAGARGVHPRPVDRRARRGRRDPRLRRRPSRRGAPGQPAGDLLPPGDRGGDPAARAVPARGRRPRVSDLTLYFVRHGESVANLSDRNGDKRPDDADRLSELGWEQARGLGRRLQGEGLELIVASPMTRAQETAQGIAEVLGLPVETDEDLFEVRQSDAFYAVLARLRRHRHAVLDADRGAGLRGARR